jgi:hypothetical protein
MIPTFWTLEDELGSTSGFYLVLDANFKEVLIILGLRHIYIAVPGLGFFHVLIVASTEFG